MNSVEARITGIDESLLDEQQKEKLEAVKKKIKDEAGIQATGGIAFSYDQKSSGKVTIVTSKDNPPNIASPAPHQSQALHSKLQSMVKSMTANLNFPNVPILQRVSPHETLARFLIG